MGLGRAKKPKNQLKLNKFPSTQQTKVFILNVLECSKREKKKSGIVKKGCKAL